MQPIEKNSVLAFIDVRSPYSYLAITPARNLAKKYSVPFNWWPYTTDFRKAYGGEIKQRSERDVAKLKYLYMDCRRLAKQQGLTIHATQKLWDPTLFNMAFLYAKQQKRLWEFLIPTLDAFWRRAYDMEAKQDVEEALTCAGLNVFDWHSFKASQGEAMLIAAEEVAKNNGIFGAPTFIFKNEMFWGNDRLNMLAERFHSAGSQPHQ